jgi:hypothetical protein
MDGDAALFDYIWLARTEADFPQPAPPIAAAGKK